VTLDTNLSVEGVLLRCGRTWMELAQVRVETDNGKWADAAGTVYVPRDRVLFTQVVAP
jgi:hypothetical protein